MSDLLELIHKVGGIERIRFVTSFPRDMTDDLLQAVRDLPKAMKYLHVPAQSGCNEILKKMKRGYTVEEYREMMHRIRAYMPDCAVSSDFIVGFCGETEESFEKSMELFASVDSRTALSSNTASVKERKRLSCFEDDIPEDVKRRRNNEMLELQNRISEEDNAEFIGRTVSVLVEGPSKSAAKKAARGQGEVNPVILWLFSSWGDPSVTVCGLRWQSTAGVFNGKDSC